MPPSSIKLAEKFRAIDDLWTPRVVAEMNDYQLKLVKIKGEFVWHQHADTDEVFLCLKGSMIIEFRDGSSRLNQGEILVVPRGTEHRPVATEECHIMLIEPQGVVNTGDAEAEELRAPQNLSI